MSEPQEPDELDATLDPDANLDDLRDGGPPQSPVTTTLAPAGSTGRPGAATRGRKPRPGAAPTTTGDATTGGMGTATGMGTSDANSTGQVGGAPSPHTPRRSQRDEAGQS